MLSAKPKSRNHLDAIKLATKQFSGVDIEYAGLAIRVPVLQNGVGFTCHMNVGPCRSMPTVSCMLIIFILFLMMCLGTKGQMETNPSHPSYDRTL